MGVFHTACTLLSIIGKHFQDAGFRDLCVESGAIVEGSVAGVLDGRRYNCGVRLHNIMHEALMRLAWQGLDRGEQEPITRSLQLPHIPVTAFSQTDLVLV